MTCVMFLFDEDGITQDVERRGITFFSVSSRERRKVVHNTVDNTYTYMKEMDSTYHACLQGNTEALFIWRIGKGKRDVSLPLTELAVPRGE